MQIFVGKIAPDFIAKAIMPDNSVELEFNLKRYVKGSRCVLVFYPLDFTFVCPSEIMAFHNRLGQFSHRNTKVISISVDSHFSHLAWKNTSYNKGGIGNVQFPMVSDITKDISRMYNVLNEDGISMRGTFLIDDTFILRHMLINDLPIGRNVDETLRVIDALEYHVNHGEVCPAGWVKGQEGMKPSAQGVSDYLASNADKL